MLTENAVIRAVKAHLQAAGYRVDKTRSTLERGIDLEAVNSATGRRLLVEAKGGTSSKKTTARYGKRFTRNQARSHVSVALYHVAKLRQHYPTSQLGMAFPDDDNHRALVDDIRSALDVLGITVFFVNPARRVRVLNNPHAPDSFLGIEHRGRRALMRA